MKSQILVIIICLLAFSLGTQAQKKQATGVRFEENWTEALNKVKENKRGPQLLLVVCEQKDNAGCRKMNNLVFKMGRVVEFMNQNFVSVKLDAENPEYTRLAEHYHMAGFPVCLILDRNQQEIGRVYGAMEPDVFIRKMEYAMNPANAVRTKLEAFNNDKTTDKARECLEAYYQAGRTGEMVKFLENTYYAFSPEERYSMEMWKYVAPALQSVSSRIFPMFLSEKYLANKYLGKSIVDGVMAGAYRQYALEYVSGKIKDDVRTALSLIGQLALIDDQNTASHYIAVASQLYAQKAFTRSKAYEHILNYLSAEKVCALEEKEREFVEHFLMSVEGMPQQLIERYKKDREAYFKKQLEQSEL